MRCIGIRHRVKKTSKGEARPTQVAISSGRKVSAYNLEDETAELDFVMHRFPVQYYEPAADEDLGKFARRHLRTRQIKKGETTDELPPNLLLPGEGKDKKKMFLVTGVPGAYEGLESEDLVAMSLGGSGDYLAFGIARHGHDIGATIRRVSPNLLKTERSGEDEEDKDKDAKLLAKLVLAKPELFRPVTPRERDHLHLRVAFRSWEEAMKARIATEQRLYQRLIGEIFCNEDGLYPEGSIEEAFLAAKANDKILVTQKSEENKREAEMLAALDKLDAFHKVLEPVEGIGTRIAARILVGAGDTNRFVVKPDQVEIERLRKEATEIAARADIDDTGLARRPKEARREFYNRVRMTKLAVGLIGDATVLSEAIAQLDKIRKLKRKAADRSVSRFKHYCGVHVRNGGKYGEVPTGCQFPKNESGEPSDWLGLSRQAFYLAVADQFKRRPESEWGKYLIKMKAGFRERHPEQVVVQAVDRNGKPKLHKKGKKKGQPIMETWYTDGHIDNMGIWRTATRFAEWVFRAIRRLERENDRAQGEAPTESTADDDDEDIAAVA